MKTFLNVLYRRILYKIPLKLLLILLAVFGLLFACTKAEFDISITDEQMPSGVNDFNLNSDEINCWYPMEQGCNFTFNTNDTYPEGNSTLKYHGDDTSFYGACYKSVHASFYISKSCLIRHINVKNVDYTSQQCQSEYNLIPIEEVDSSYCQSNNLCPAGGTPSDCPNVGVSNLFINDIFHPGAFNIIMNIPEEISRDYAYTNSGNNFNLDIEGYNVDYEKMQSVIDRQSYIPTNEDFQNIILLIGPYGKIIIFFVFLFILWAWIKKPFKSKL